MGPGVDQFGLEPGLCLVRMKINDILGCINKCCQQVKGGDPSPLLSTDEATRGVFCLVNTGSPVLETHGQTG